MRVYRPSSLLMRKDNNSLGDKEKWNEKEVDTWKMNLMVSWSKKWIEVRIWIVRKSKVEAEWCEQRGWHDETLRGQNKADG